MTSTVPTTSAVSTGVVAGSAASSSSSSPPSKRDALVIGIDGYQNDIPRLHGAVNDALKMKDCLEKQHNFQVRILAKRATARSGEKFNGEPTREKILSELERLANVDNGGGGGGENDVVVIYYSGHGSWCANGLTHNNRCETIVPCDSSRGSAGKVTDIFDLELRERIVAINEKRTRNVVLLFDSCHSGDIAKEASGDASGEVTRLAPRFGKGDDQEVEREAMARLEALLRKPIPSASYVLLAACDYTEVAWEMKEKGGVFTTALLAELNQSAVAAARSYRDILDNVKAAVATARGARTKQTPIGDGLSLRTALFQSSLLFEREREYRVKSANGYVLEIDGGRMHGVVERSKWKVFSVATNNADDGQLVAEAVCERVDSASSRIVTNGVDLTAHDSTRRLTACCYWLPLERRPKVAVECVVVDAVEAKLDDVIAQVKKSIDESSFVQLESQAKVVDYVVRVGGKVVSSNGQFDESQVNVSVWNASGNSLLISPSAKGTWSTQDWTKQIRFNLDQLANLERVLQIRSTQPMPFMKVSLTSNDKLIVAANESVKASIQFENKYDKTVYAFVAYCQLDGAVRLKQSQHAIAAGSEPTSIVVDLGVPFETNDKYFDTKKLLALKVFVTAVEGASMDGLEQSEFAVRYNEETVAMGIEASLPSPDAWMACEFIIETRFKFQVSNERDSMTILRAQPPQFDLNALGSKAARSNLLLVLQQATPTQNPAYVQGLEFIRKNYRIVSTVPEIVVFVKRDEALLAGEKTGVVNYGATSRVLQFLSTNSSSPATATTTQPTLLTTAAATTTTTATSSTSFVSQPIVSASSNSVGVQTVVVNDVGLRNILLTNKTLSTVHVTLIVGGRTVFAAHIAPDTDGRLSFVDDNGGVVIRIGDSVEQRVPPMVPFETIHWAIVGGDTSNAAAVVFFDWHVWQAKQLSAVAAVSIDGSRAVGNESTKSKLDLLIGEYSEGVDKQPSSADALSELARNDGAAARSLRESLSGKAGDWGHRGVNYFNKGPTFERDYLQARRSALAKRLGVREQSVPRIGVAFSGGGLRAMIATIATLDAMVESGLLPYVASLSGLSGSTWALASWAVCDGNPFVTKECDPWSHSDGASSLEPLYRILDRSVFSARNWRGAISQVFHDWREGNAETTGARAWGSFVGQALLSDRFGGDRFLVEFADAVALLSNDNPIRPYPICTAVHKSTGMKDWEWIEFTPHEVAQSGKANVWRIDSRDFGKRFSPDFSQVVIDPHSDDSVDALPTASLGYLFGIWGSAFAADAKEVVEGAVDGSWLNGSWLGKKLNALSSDQDRPLPHTAAKVPAWFAGHGDDDDDMLYLRDGGACFNLALPPLCDANARAMDIVVSIDASAGVAESLDKGEEPGEWTKAKEYMRRQIANNNRHNTTTYVFPSSDDQVDKDSGVRTVRRDDNVDKISTPSVLYVPVPSSFKTTKFQYSRDEARALYSATKRRWFRDGAPKLHALLTAWAREKNVDLAATFGASFEKITMKTTL